MGKRSVPKTVLNRARKIAGRRFRREFGERFLKRLGFDSDDFKKGGLVKKKLGLFGGPISAGMPGAAGPGAQPAVEKPQREPKKSNPSITTIISQLDKLVKTANKVGILSKEQQDAMLGQIAQARRIAKEQLQESKPTPIPETPDAGNTSDALSPLNDIIQDLIKQINKLTNKVEDKVEEQDNSTDRGFMERFLDRRGYDGAEYARGRKLKAQRKAARDARIRTKPGYKIEYSQGRIKYRNLATGKYAKAAEAVATGRTATKIGGTKLAKAVTSTKIAKAIGAGAKGAGAGLKVGTSAIKSAVRRVAGPLIAKSLGKTALKSIPIIGAVAGVGFAIDRLVKGDPVGAGLDLMSGLGGPVTAIPALAMSLSRDAYAEVFGVPPEQDPDYNKNFPIIKTSIEDLIKEQLGQSVTPKQKPTQSQVDKALVPSQSPQKPPVQRQSAPSLGTQATPPSSPTPTSGGGGGGGAAGQAKSASASPSPSSPAPTPVPAASTSTGTELIGAEAPSPPMSPALSNIGFDNTMRRFVPQTSPSSKSGHVGIGTVPNPDYVPSVPNNLPTLYKVMFFNVNYQVQ